MRRILPLGILLAAAVSQGAVTITWTQVGDKFHGEVSGSLTAAELAENADASQTQNSLVGGYFDSKPSFFSVVSSQTSLRNYIYTYDKVVLGPGGANIDVYRGVDYTPNQVSGSTSFIFYDYFSTMFFLRISQDYVAGSALSSTLITDRWGSSLTDAFNFGTVATLNGAAFITYVNGGVIGGNGGGGAPVPEPSTYGLALGGLALVGAVMRRRKNSK